jgi:hypothetical protein
MPRVKLYIGPTPQPAWESMTRKRIVYIGHLPWAVVEAERPGCVLELYACRHCTETSPDLNGWTLSKVQLRLASKRYDEVRSFTVRFTG